jgi:hypothetical protein
MLALITAPHESPNCSASTVAITSGDSASPSTFMTAKLTSSTD